MFSACVLCSVGFIIEAHQRGRWSWQTQGAAALGFLPPAILLVPLSVVLLSLVFGKTLLGFALTVGCQQRLLSVLLLPLSFCCRLGRFGGVAGITANVVAARRRSYFRHIVVIRSRFL